MGLLRTLLLFSRRLPQPPRPEWTPADADLLHRFLQSHTGAKLRHTLISEISAATDRAAMKATPFECGWACGYRGLYAWFEALSAPALADEQSNSETDSPGEGSGLEHLSP